MRCENEYCVYNDEYVCILDILHNRFTVIKIKDFYNYQNKIFVVTIFFP